MNQSFEAAAQVIQSVMAPGMEILVQVVITVVKGITALVNLFIKLPKPVQVFIVAIMGILAAIGPMLIMVTMAQLKFQQFSAGLALVQGNIGKLGGGLSKLSASFSALGGGPLILIVAAVLAAVAAFIYFYKTNETFRNSINSLASAIQGAVSAAFGKLVGLLQQIQPAFQQVMAVLNNFCSRLRENGDYFFNNWSCASRRFASGLQLGSNLLGQFGGTFDKAGLAVGLLVKVLTKVALAALGISGPFGLIISLIVSFVTAWMKTGDLSVGGITQVFDNLGNTITSVTTMLATNLPKVIQLLQQS